MYKKMLFVFICITASTALLAENALAEEKPERTIYGDWFTLCAKSEDICTMNQVQYMENEQGKSRILHANIVKNPQNPSQLVMQLILPLGVVLRPGVLVKVDQGEEFTVHYHTCASNGCIALVPLSGKRLQLFRNGNEALVGFRPLGTEKTAVIKMSLKGFTKASNVVKNSTGS